MIFAILWKKSSFQKKKYHHHNHHPNSHTKSWIGKSKFDYKGKSEHLINEKTGIKERKREFAESLLRCVLIWFCWVKVLSGKKRLNKESEQICVCVSVSVRLFSCVLMNGPSVARWMYQEYLQLERKDWERERRFIWPCILIHNHHGVSNIYQRKGERRREREREKAGEKVAPRFACESTMHDVQAGRWVFACVCFFFSSSFTFFLSLLATSDKEH